MTFTPVDNASVGNGTRSMPPRAQIMYLKNSIDTAATQPIQFESSMMMDLDASIVSVSHVMYFLFETFFNLNLMIFSFETE